MRPIFLFLGLAALVWWGGGQLRARRDTPWTSQENGLESRTFSWHGVTVHAFRAAPTRVEVATGATLDAANWRAKTNSRVAVNGGYFDEVGRPLGLRVSKNHQTSGLRKADWGVFWIAKGQAHISHTRDFSSRNAVVQALQCGPRLVVDGHPTDLKPQWSRRSGVGIDSRKRVVLAVADGQLSLEDWAQAWASSDGLSCRDALNLDGGPSTQISYATAKSRGDITGGWPIPDALVIR